MTTLRDILMERAATQPLTLADYMATALLHPTLGYYNTRDPLGAGGDFITAPEISQMFGELVGLSLAQAWIDQGRSASFTLAELGPGRGTLMADILRAASSVAGFTQAADIHLVEASPPLRAQQAKRLPDGVTWHDSASTLPEAPLFLVANEFFDALPIRQFQRDGARWREVLVAVQSETLVRSLSDPTDTPDLAHRIEDTKTGDIVEFCPALPETTGHIAGRIARHGGAALIVDYGDWRSLGDTLQAVRNHEHVDVFSVPGNADLTAHVDFEALASAAAPAKFTRLSTQGVFLERLGITQRADALAATLSGDALDNLISAHKRLTDPSEMGSLFKVMGLYPRDAPPPAGLEP